MSSPVPLRRHADLPQVTRLDHGASDRLHPVRGDNIRRALGCRPRLLRFLRHQCAPCGTVHGPYAGRPLCPCRLSVSSGKTDTWKSRGNHVVGSSLNVFSHLFLEPTSYHSMSPVTLEGGVTGSQHLTFHLFFFWGELHIFRVNFLLTRVCGRALNPNLPPVLRPPPASSRSHDFHSLKCCNLYWSRLQRRCQKLTKQDQRQLLCIKPLKKQAKDLTLCPNYLTGRCVQPWYQ